MFLKKMDKYGVTFLTFLLMGTGCFSGLLGQRWELPKPGAIYVMQMVEGDHLARRHADALPSLLKEINDKTSAEVAPDPIIVSSFEDPAFLTNAFLYINFADRMNWELSDSERAALKNFLERGGFIYIDEGVKSEFLRDTNRLGQGHSFADWEVRPEVEAIFGSIFPNKRFRPLERDHEVFHIYQGGLPDASALPDTVRDFVVNEKWPGGTYSVLGLTLEKRVAVIATPILAIGWGKDEVGNWIGPISFRIRESAEGLTDRLSQAAYSGGKYEATREDGLKDVIFTQRIGQPAWVQEPSGRWRLFRYYRGSEISDYAHRFYTQLGVNIFVYGFCN